MRVSDRSTARNYLKYMNSARSSYDKTNLQVASGNRFTKLSDDVAAGTRVLHTRMDMYRTEKHLGNVQAIADEMNNAETAIRGMSDLLSRAHELMVGAVNDGKGEIGRKAIADELKTMKQELLQLVNTTYGKNYTFGGTNAGSAAPFKVDADGNIHYNGIAVNDIQKDIDGYFYMDENGLRKDIPMDEPVYMDVGLGITKTQTQLDGGSGFLISFNGLDLVGYGKDGDGDPGNIYNLLTELEVNLRDYDKEKVERLSSKLEKQTDIFGGNVTEIGARTKQLETMEERLKGRVGAFKNHIQNLMGMDPAEGAIQQKMDDFVWKSVLQMGSRILPVSLMDFLR